MAHKVVKYRLEADGTIPTFLKFGVAQGTGGMYPVKDSTASPRDYVMLGIADDGVDISTAVGEIASKNDLTTYLTSVSDGNGWKQLGSDGEEEDFVPATAATKIWDDLDTLNG
tara:strand:+ start:14510 stop:14848 length:339 start_codon:yes stop_codon:yes gene_type:complete